MQSRDRKLIGLLTGLLDKLNRLQEGSVNKRRRTDSEHNTPNNSSHQVLKKLSETTDLPLAVQKWRKEISDLINLQSDEVIFLTLAAEETLNNMLKYSSFLSEDILGTVQEINAELKMNSKDEQLSNAFEKLNFDKSVNVELTPSPNATTQASDTLANTNQGNFPRTTYLA